MLHRITEVFEEVTDAYESFQFFKFFQTVQNFCVVDLSNFYLDIAKDRLYISSANSLRRRSCQTVLQIALENLTKAIAPVLSHLAEDIWQFLPYKTPYESVFQAGWLTLNSQWNQPKLAKKWKELLKLRSTINKLIESERGRSDQILGSSLEASLLIYVSNLEFYQQLQELNPPNSFQGNRVDELRYLFLVSKVEVFDSKSDFLNAAPDPERRQQLEDAFDYSESPADKIFSLDRADKNNGWHKCDRCWNYSLSVGTFPEDPTICDRCESALKGEF
jgi:isoleucyl-tRNA synthetase